VYAPLRSRDEWRQLFAKRFSGHVDEFGQSLYDLVDALSDVGKFSRGDDERVFETYWSGIS
jgi:hypothetical protein